MLSLLMTTLAVAGTVEIQTTLPIDVRLDDVQVARAYGASTIQLPNVPAGAHRLTAYRSGTPETIDVAVPETGVVRVFVSEDTFQMVNRSPQPQPGASEEVAAPTAVVFASRDGASFLVRIDGDDGQTIGPGAPLRIGGLSPGPHQVVISRPDELVVWVRGTLILEPGDALEVRMAEGRMAQVVGRPGAWKPGK